MPRVRNQFVLWEQIFKDKDFDLSQDLHFITADEIKRYAEPRNMAKMDSTEDLPPVFKRNGYFLLPTKNGRYAIVRGNGFHRLEKDCLESVVDHESKIKFQLATAGRGMSEMQYLDNAHNTGALEIVIGKGHLYQSIRGREYTKKFSFNVGSIPIDTESVQIEVDSGLEGRDSIILIEAKVKTPDDFIIRQLYYPFRHFKILAPQKEIVPVFFTYEPADKVYNFWIYEFGNALDYNSIRLKETKSLRIVTKDMLGLDDIRPQGIVEYNGPIPQANDLDKVLELVYKVSEGINSATSIAEYFSFDVRQSSYYREAAEALGLVRSENGKYTLTEIGMKLVSLPADKRNTFFASILLDFSVVNESIQILEHKKTLSRTDLESIVARNSNLTGSTVARRALSLSAWLKWISSNLYLFSWDDKRKVFLLERGR